MKVTLAEPRYLKDSISIISDLVSETRFKFTSAGLTIISMDPANVAMVIFKLLSSCFTEYNLQKDEDLGLNLNNLKQIFRRVEASDIVTLETDSSKLKITIKGTSTRRFAVPIIALDDKEQKEPPLEFPVEISMPTALLSAAIEDADIVADSVSFICDTNKFTLAASGDLNDAEVDILASDEVQITNDAGATIRSKYSIEYLKKMIAGAKIADTVTVRMGKDYPIKISFVTVDKLSLSFVLAPRVESD